MKRIKNWFIHKWDWLVEKYYAWRLKRMNKNNKDPFIYK